MSARPVRSRRDNTAFAAGMVALIGSFVLGWHTYDWLRGMLAFSLVNGFIHALLVLTLVMLLTIIFVPER